jgi:hypothetical protein
MSDVWQTSDASPIETGVATFGDWMRNIRLIFSRGMPILGAWAVLTALTVVAQVPQWLIGAYVAMAGPDAHPATLLLAAGLQVVFALLNMVIALALAAMIMGLQRAVRMVLIEPGSVTGPVHALQIASTRFLPTFGMSLVVMLITFAGMLLCLLPGMVAAFLLSMACYLVAATDIEWGAALGKSYELVVKNVGLFLVVWLGLIVASFVVVGGMTGVSIGLSLINHVAQAVATPLMSMVLAVVYGLPVFVMVTSLNLAAEMADSRTVVAE